MDFLIDGLKYAVVAWLFWTAWRTFRYRLAISTFGDSNAPNGLRIDWDAFWGRR